MKISEAIDFCLQYQKANSKINEMADRSKAAYSYPSFFVQGHVSLLPFRWIMPLVFVPKMRIMGNREG